MVSSKGPGDSLFSEIRKVGALAKKASHRAAALEAEIGFLRDLLELTKADLAQALAEVERLKKEAEGAKKV